MKRLMVGPCVKTARISAGVPTSTQNDELVRGRDGRGAKR